MTPTDPQDAGETRVEWRNVYPEGDDGIVRELGLDAKHSTRDEADRWAHWVGEIPRIAVERIETTTKITRIAVRKEGV